MNVEYVEAGLVPSLVSPKWAAGLVAILNRKIERGVKNGTFGEVWYRLIRAEVSRVISKLGQVSTRELHACQKLAEFYYVRYGYIPESWYGLFPPQTFYHTLARCELDWVCANLDKVSAKHRDMAVDLLDEYVAACGEFKPEWMLIYPH